MRAVGAVRAVKQIEDSVCEDEPASVLDKLEGINRSRIMQAGFSAAGGSVSFQSAIVREVYTDVRTRQWAQVCPNDRGSIVETEKRKPIVQEDPVPLSDWAGGVDRTREDRWSSFQSG